MSRIYGVYRRAGLVHGCDVVAYAMARSRSEEMVTLAIGAARRFNDWMTCFAGGTR